MTPERRMKSSEISDLILEVADRQHGVASRRQFLDAGVSRHAIDSRIRSGRLVPLYPGVYSALRTSDSSARWMAAVLCGGPGSLICRRSAACLWGFGPPERQTSVLRGFNKKLDAPAGARLLAARGLLVHRTRTLMPEDIASKDGIPVTSVARTLLDLAMTSRNQLEEFFDSAARCRLLRREELLRVLDRGPGWNGIGRLRVLVEEWDPLLATSRSGLEMEFLGLCRRSKLPEPLMNSRLAGHEVDFLWPTEKLVVEVDGFSFHSGQDAFESDHARDADLAMAGYRVLRFTYRKVTLEPEFVTTRVKALLAQ